MSVEDMLADVESRAYVATVLTAVGELSCGLLLGAIYCHKLRMISRKDFIKWVEAGWDHVDDNIPAAERIRDIVRAIDRVGKDSVKLGDVLTRD